MQPVKITLTDAQLADIAAQEAANVPPVVTPPPVPTITGLSALPAQVHVGEDVTISCTTRDATSVQLDGAVMPDALDPATGQVVMTATMHVIGPWDFVVTAIGPGGSSSSSASVEVIAAPAPPPTIVEPPFPAEPHHIRLNFQRIVATVKQVPGNASGIDRYWRALPPFIERSATPGAPCRIQTTFYVFDLYHGGTGYVYGTSTPIQLVYPTYFWRATLCDYATGLYTGRVIDGPDVAVTVTGAANKHGAPIELTIPGDAGGLYQFRVMAKDASGAVVDPDVQVAEGFLIQQGIVDTRLDGSLQREIPVPAELGTYSMLRLGLEKDAAGKDTGFTRQDWAVLPQSAIGPYPGTPLADRGLRPFSDVLKTTDLIRINVVPIQDGDVVDVAYSHDGFLTLWQKHRYFIDDVRNGPYPVHSVLDGPFPQARVFCATAGIVGRKGSFLGTDGRRIFRLNPDGTLITRGGFRNKDNRQHLYTEAQQFGGDQFEFVGTRDPSISFEEAAPDDSWGYTIVPSTTQIDATSPLIGGEHSHVKSRPGIYDGVRVLTTNVRGEIQAWDCVKDDRDTPTHLTRPVVGLPDPWAIVPIFEGVNGDDMILNLRGAHQTVIWNASTMNVVRVLADDPGVEQLLTFNGAVVWRRWDRKTGVTLAQLQQRKIAAPEGAAYWPAKRTAFIASQVMQQVRGFNLDTGAVTIACNPEFSTSNKSYYSTISMAPGWAPDGSILHWSWSENRGGRPQCFVPNEYVIAHPVLYPPAQYPIANGDPTHKYEWRFHTEQYDVLQGAVGATETQRYACAGAAGHGHLWCFGSNGGVSLFMPRDPATEPLLTSAQLAAIRAGSIEWKAAGLDAVYGVGGFGSVRGRLPWGRSANVDAYLVHLGHRRAA